MEASRRQIPPQRQGALDLSDDSTAPDSEQEL